MRHASYLAFIKAKWGNIYRTIISAEIHTVQQIRECTKLIWLLLYTQEKY